MQTPCPGCFGAVCPDAEPAPGGADIGFVDDPPATCPRPDLPLPAEFVRALAQGFREGREARGRGRSPYATRPTVTVAPAPVTAPPPEGDGDFTQGVWSRAR